MIRSISQLLRGFSDAEAEKMEAMGITHGPTIGDMYEGLTSEILSRSIPGDLGLRIVRGFIEGPAGSLSKQVDCMLVRGEGRLIPHTENFIWPIQDVLVVLEVKKTLYSDDHIDAFEKLSIPVQQFFEYLKENSDMGGVNISPARDAYARLTGEIPPHPDEYREMPFEKHLLFFAIAFEQISPIRIAFGYNGFKSEKSLRDSLLSFVEENVGERGFGVTSFPQLSISGEYSMIKLNGFPYQIIGGNDWWTFLASTKVNPIELMLELIWTRLRRDYPQLGNLWGEDLEQEILHPCFQARPKEEDGITGWEFRTVDVSLEELKDPETHEQWAPVFVSDNEFIIFQLLCANKIIHVEGGDILDLSQKEGVSVGEFVNGLLGTGLIGIRGDELRLLTYECGSVILPDGRNAVAENNSGRFMRWLSARPRPEGSS